VHVWPVLVAVTMNATVLPLMPELVTVTEKSDHRHWGGAAVVDVGGGTVVATTVVVVGDAGGTVVVSTERAALVAGRIVD
jgi:uncharacterized membrane protein